MTEDLLSVDEARRRLVALAPPPRVVAVPLREARGLVLAQVVAARGPLPAFDNSAMDGFAVRARDVLGASPEAPARLRLTGEVAAGSVYAGTVEPGEAVRIMTGAPVPAGADAVIEVERSHLAAGWVMLDRGADPGNNIRPAGGDIEAGEEALAAGTHLGPAQLALLAALGEAEPRCLARPRVAVLATGDELVEPGAVPGPGQVVNIVGTAIAAAVEDAGAVAVVIPPARDTAEDIRRALQAAMAAADVVVSVGGVSMGEYDLVRPAVQELGRLDFWRVAMRPGKPLAVGRLGDCPFVGLPGNPVSALVGVEVYLLPLLLSMSGRPAWARPRVTAELGAPLSTPPGLRTFARARLERREGAVPVATPVPGQGSHQLRWLAAANCLLDIPEDAGGIPEDAGELAPGAAVTAILVDQPPGPAG